MNTALSDGDSKLLAIAEYGWLPLLVSFLLGAVVATAVQLWAQRDRPSTRAGASLSPLHILAHEVRTPLSLIKGAAELLRNRSLGPLLPEQQRLIDTISANADHVVMMAENTLLAARIEASARPLELRKCDLRALVRDTARQLRDIHHHPIIVDDPGEPLWLRLDAALIRQVIWNLINNAVRHCPDQCPIRVRSYRHETTTILEIGDRGEGMTATQRQDLFTPFSSGAIASPEQADRPSSDNGEKAASEPLALPVGTGIGMGIVKTILEQHHARLIVDTMAGKGTTMIVEFPSESHC